MILALEVPMPDMIAVTLTCQDWADVAAAFDKLPAAYDSPGIDALYRSLAALDLITDAAA